MNIKNVSKTNIFTEFGKLKPGFSGECSEATGAAFIDDRLAEDVTPVVPKPNATSNSKPTTRKPKSSKPRSS